MYDNRRIVVKTGTNAAVGTTTEATIPVGSAEGGRKICIHEFAMGWLSGSGNQFRPVLALKTGSAVHELETLYWHTTTPSTPDHVDATNLLIFCDVDPTTGNLYIQFNVDAGSDNSMWYKVAYEVIG